jgi:hypothetical protein
MSILEFQHEDDDVTQWVGLVTLFCNHFIDIFVYKKSLHLLSGESVLELNG